MKITVFLLFLLNSFALSSAVYAQNSGGIDFGDNASEWAYDDECDDPRFSGGAMASTLLEEDSGHDAADCQAKYNAGIIVFNGGTIAVSNANIDFGDNSSEWAFDNECDDPRFTGENMAETLVEADERHDAEDCRALFNAGQITYSISVSANAPSNIDFGDDLSNWAEDNECDDPRFSGQGMAGTLVESDTFHDATDCRSLYAAGEIVYEGITQTESTARTERGTLEYGDDTLESEEYVDTYTFNGNAGQTGIFDLRSEDFDTYIIVTTPSGEQFDNDDFEGDQSRSLLALELSESGAYEVMVTAYQSGDAGSYTLSMNTQNSENGNGLDESGQLSSADDTLASGEYVDAYEVEARPGQHLRISLESSDFDAYVILQSPNGESKEDDDSGADSNSLIETDTSEVGTYRVLVTSYESGEAGSYRLKVEQTEMTGDSSSSGRDLIALDLDETISGNLQDGDIVLEAGEYQDLYVFNGVEGQTIRIDLRSDDFDTYVGLVTPDGENIDNDDFEGSSDHSVVEVTLQQSGRFRIFATSYAANETGQYSLSLSSQSGVQATARGNSSNTGEGKIYGVFAGIADYPGTGNDLSFTDQDAVRIRDALIQGAGMNPADAITLLDSQATLENFAASIQSVAAQMSPEDTFVLFYSGHGAQVERIGGFESTDPDGKDETIELYDGALLDNELNNMLSQINVGTSLIVLDSCFSGGFAKDIISMPGRMGLFSSEEDVTSQVASKFRAGGYLSFFFEEALTQPYADIDRNGGLSALELSQYLHERFRSDVKAFGDEQYVRTGGPQSGYQHLVVDRGGIGPYDILF